MNFKCVSYLPPFCINDSNPQAAWTPLVGLNLRAHCVHGWSDIVSACGDVKSAFLFLFVQAFPESKAEVMTVHDSQHSLVFFGLQVVLQSYDASLCPLSLYSMNLPRRCKSQGVPYTATIGAQEVLSPINPEVPDLNIPISIYDSRFDTLQ